MNTSNKLLLSLLGAVLISATVFLIILKFNSKPRVMDFSPRTEVPAVPEVPESPEAPEIP